MKLRAKIVPYSSVVGQSVMLIDPESGACVALVSIRPQNADTPEKHRSISNAIAIELGRAFR